MADSVTPITKHRATITFVPPAVTALRSLMQRTGMSQQDTVNRAVQIYDFVEKAMADGNELLLRKTDGSTEMIHIV